MTLHLGYPTVTKGYKLIGVTPVDKPTKAHRHHTCSEPRTMLIGFPHATFQEPNHLDLVTQLDPSNHVSTNRVKDPCRS
jgi:hypothetical protein